MRRRAIILVLMAVLAAGGRVPAQEPASAPGLDQAQEILDKTIAALGGSAFLNVRDIERRGRLYGFDRGELASPGDRFVDYVKFPGKEWLGLGKDSKIVYLNDNEEGWELDRQGIREQTPEQIENFQRSNRHDLEYLLRFRLREEKFGLYYLGREFVDNRRAHVVELVDVDSRSVKLVVDGQSYLPVQIRYEQREPLSGARLRVVDYYAKYITVQGIKTPMHLSRETQGKRSFEAYLEEVKYNTGVTDEFFSKAALEEHWRKVK